MYTCEYIHTIYTLSNCCLFKESVTYASITIYHEPSSIRSREPAEGVVLRPAPLVVLASRSLILGCNVIECTTVYVMLWYGVV